MYRSVPESLNSGWLGWCVRYANDDAASTTSALRLMDTSHSARATRGLRTRTSFSFCKESTTVSDALTDRHTDTHTHTQYPQQ